MRVRVSPRAPALDHGRKMAGRHAAIRRFAAAVFLPKRHFHGLRPIDPRAATRIHQLGRKSGKDKAGLPWSTRQAIVAQVETPPDRLPAFFIDRQRFGRALPRLRPEIVANLADRFQSEAVRARPDTGLTAWRSRVFIFLKPRFPCIQNASAGVARTRGGGEASAMCRKARQR